MTGRSNSCPKCQGAMDQGFVVDASYTESRQSTWMNGTPERNIWLGGIKTSGRERFPVTTYRCTRCGYLESYAAPVAK